MNQSVRRKTKIKRISNKSRIEIWGSDYINNNTINPRRPEDSTDKVNIIQIEPGSDNSDNYMVEIEPKENKEDQSKNNDLIFATGKLSAMKIIVNRLIEECNNPNRNWYGNAIYLEIREVLHDVETGFKKELDDVAGETVSK